MQLQGSSIDLQRAVNWIQRLIRLDASVFDEVRSDPSATSTGIAIVVVTSVLSGIGSWLWVIVNLKSQGAGSFFIDTVILGSIFHVALWFAWVFISYAILTQVFRARADSTQMVRTMGLGTAPLAITALMFIPVVDWTIGLVAVVTTVVLMNYAIQATTSATPPQVSIANIAGFAVLVFVLSLLASSDHNRAPGFYSFDSWKDIVIEIRAALFGFGDFPLR